MRTRLRNNEWSRVLNPENYVNYRNPAGGTFWSGYCVNLAVNAFLAGILPTFAYEFLEEKS